MRGIKKALRIFCFYLEGSSFFFDRFFLCSLLVIISYSFEGKCDFSFEKKEILIGKKSLKVEIADTSEKTSKGLMFRTSLKEEEGMLFIFSSEEYRSFWMKNTFIPLSIGYFDKNKALIDIQNMKPMRSEMETFLPSYKSLKPAQYALEVNQGWFQRNNIKIGEKFTIKK